MDDHPAQRIDDLVHHKGRLAVLAVLHELPRASFTEIREALGQPDGSVGRYINALEDAGFVEVERTWEGRRPRSLASITTVGRRALAAHLDTMGALIERFDQVAGGEPRAGSRQELAVLFAMSATHAESAVASVPASVEGGGGLSGLKAAVLDEPPGEFTSLGGGPISRFFEFPRVPGVNERFSPSFEQLQRLYMRHGLTGGYALGWVRAAGSDDQLNVAARVFEVAHPEAAHALVDVVPWGDDLETGIPRARSNLTALGDKRSQANAFFPAHRMVGLVIVYGPTSDVVEVARSSARRQYDRMTAADLSAGIDEH